MLRLCARRTANAVFHVELKRARLVRWVFREETLSRTGAEPKYRNWLLDSVAAGRERMLLMNCSGIILPPQTDRTHALPDAEVKDCLTKLSASRTRLIVISARPAYEVSALLALTPAPEIWGDSGLERIYPDGRYECNGLKTPVESLKVLIECVSTLAQAGLRDLTHTRLAAVVVRCNQLNEAEELEARTSAYRVFHPLAAANPALHIVESDDGVELRLRAGGKGDAVRRLIAVTPADVPIAYLGSDSLDEDAFRALSGRGLTVLVRTVPRFSAAQVCLRPDEIVGFLNDWIRHFP